MSHSATGRSFSKGEAVLYLTKDGRYVAATVAAVDISMIPPAYTITLDAEPSKFRDTIGPRLKPAAAMQDMHLDSEWSICPAPCCQSIITAGQLQVKQAIPKHLALMCQLASQKNLPAKGWHQSTSAYSIRPHELASWTPCHVAYTY